MGKSCELSLDEQLLFKIHYIPSQTKSYDFLLKAGQNYQDAIYNLCKRMIKEEEFPMRFRKTMLFMLWKQKGPQEVLKNNRFIHLKEHYLPRTVEALVVDQMKEDILENSTMYQVGGHPGHCIYSQSKA